MKFGVVVFPGSNCDHDAYYAVRRVIGEDARFVWHTERDLESYDVIILPGGFSYGDYLRAGAIARFSPILESVIAHAKKGKPVIGICNGFQVLCECGLLPGALIRNRSLKFSCKWVNLRYEATGSIFTERYYVNEIVSMPIAHGEGNYFADNETLAMLEDTGRIVWRYCAPDGTSEWSSSDAEIPAYNPNGSLNNIAGIRNEFGNVLGMMPHPERACESVTGGMDGLRIFESVING
ncbi:phosphoribosylformylglycinamidine synthase subunit PurQ [bacterium]|nr:phosphoribosylformylglycinamidine synthase subunit PurQ [bacterium]